MRNAASICILACLIMVVAAISPIEAQNQEKKVLLVEVNGFISPATAEYLGSAVNAASQPGYTALLLTIDTFGGSADAMFKIVEWMQSSPVPVIGFVYPAGRQALSAGVYILMASDFAAMAPYTTIGSAQPIVGETPVTESKIINAYVQKMVGYARLHGRNETQAARFVTENDNLLPEEALKLHVIEAVAESPEELLRIADGTVVNTLRGRMNLDTSGAVIVRHGSSVRDFALKTLSDPLVSSILITVGFLSLILGLTTPGLESVRGNLQL